MKQVWQLIRRHPFATIILAILIAAFLSDPSSSTLVGFIVLGLIVLAISFIIGRIRARRRGSTEQLAPDMPIAPATVRWGGQPAQIAPTPASVVDPYQSVLKPQSVGMTPQQMAATTDSEPLTPAGQSAFAETAHRPIPTAPQRESTLININHLLAMTPTGFEEFCVRALEGIGYKEVRRVGGAGDLTADIFGVDNMGRSTVVQCKRYKPGTKVGSPALQMFIGMKSVHHQVERGIYMTTADYSVPAVRLARQHDIVLIDGDDLIKIAGLVMMPQSTPQVAAGAARYCTNCGAEFSGEERFCKSCGAARAA